MNQLFESVQNNSVRIPAWLDDLIFNTLAAVYEPQNKDLVVLEWSKDEIQKYLGTYFPRSFAESLCIFSKYFSEKMDEYKKINEISVLDFGCGTGGEIVGFILAVSKILPHVKNINIRAFDGNRHTLKELESILSETSHKTNIEINHSIFPIEIEDSSDMETLDRIINQEFDFIISFKAICEFVTKQQFDSINPYKHFLNVFLPKLSDIGVICVADISSLNNTSKEWLPSMMDAALISCGKADIVDRNSGFNECYYISHSRRKRDVSKIFWRILKPRG